MQDAMAAVEDIREYDVPFHVRYAIDAGLRSGHWFAASAHEGVVTLTPRTDLIFRGEPRVCAFDIETTKLPLHFPNSEHDQVRYFRTRPDAVLQQESRRGCARCVFRPSSQPLTPIVMQISSGRAACTAMPRESLPVTQS